MNNNMLGCVVFNENTLGCLFPFFNGVILDVIGSKTLEGGANWRNGPIPILDFQYKNIRMATKADFKDFNIYSKGYFLS